MRPFIMADEKPFNRMSPAVGPQSAGPRPVEWRCLCADNNNVDDDDGKGVSGLPAAGDFSSASCANGDDSLDSPGGGAGGR
jgi:hypothetical protein